ncbi:MULTISPECIES: hypothetical protein [unclassified Glutamicibacter]
MSDTEQMTPEAWAWVLVLTVGGALACYGALVGAILGLTMIGGAL